MCSSLKTIDDCCLTVTVFIAVVINSIDIDFVIGDSHVFKIDGFMCQ